MEANKKLSEIVSRETLEKLENYKSLILKWNEKTNLLSKKTTEQALDAHIVDCIDLFENLKNHACEVYDIGSGSGLPGIVLSLMGAQKITLIEADLKKAVFLEETKRLLNLNINVIRCRVETIKDSMVDIIVSRAMTSTDNLIKLSENLLKKDTQIYLMKSESQLEEIDQARKNWGFECALIKNQYIENHLIYHITNIVCLKNANHYAV